MRGGRELNWFMLVFWGVGLALIVGGYLFDRLTGNKVEWKKTENSLIQNRAEADSYMETQRHQNGMF